MLVLEGLDAFYGASQVLFGATLELREGQVVTLMGRNGMGKTTLIRSVIGLLRSRKGRISFLGQSITGWPSHRIARLGIGLVPEGRHVYPLLSVRENLLATARSVNGEGPWSLDSVYRLFPRLRERAEQKATTLSGGEQQMLSIGRALMTNPKLLLMDEATEGLAPVVRAEIWNCVAALKKSGLAILIVDRNIEALMAIADRHFILEKGRVVWSGSSTALRSEAAMVTSYLSV